MQLRWLLSIVLLAGCNTPKATEQPTGNAPAIALLPASYGENARPPAKECKFDQALTRSIAKTVPGAKTESSADDQMKVVITRVQGADPNWQGDISVIVEGELSGAESRKFRFKRGAPPGVTGGMRGVCKGLETVADLLAEDIADWVVSAPASGGTRSGSPTEANEESSMAPEIAPTEGRDVDLDEIVDE